MSLAVTAPAVSKELARTIGALLPLAFAFAAVLCRKDDELRPEEREPEQQLPLFLATREPHEPSYADPRLVSRRPSGRTTTRG